MTTALPSYTTSRDVTFNRHRRAGLDPAIHGRHRALPAAWMRGSGPRMTMENGRGVRAFPSLVIAGLDPAIHGRHRALPAAWMRGSGPRMTMENGRGVRASPSIVIAGLDPAIHGSRRALTAAWMRGSSPRMTKKGEDPRASPPSSSLRFSRSPYLGDDETKTKTVQGLTGQP